MAQNTAQEDNELLLDFHSQVPFRHEDETYSGKGEYENIGYEEEYISSSPLITIARVGLVLATLGWIGFAAYLFYRRGFTLPALEQIPYITTVVTMPLILVAVVYQLLLRGSVGEADRFARITKHLRKESEALDMRMAIVNQQLDTARETMREQAMLLEEYGASASINLEAAAKTMAQHANTSAQQSETIERAGLSLAHQFGQLIDSLPAVEERAQRVSTTLSDGSEALTDKIDRLETRLESLVKLTEDARSRTLNATQSLTAQLLQVQDSTRSAGDEVNGMADLSANRIANAVEQARQAIEETGSVLDSHIANLNGLVEQSQGALDSIGGKAVAAYGESIGHIENRLHNLDRLVDQQSAVLTVIGDELGQRIEQLSERFQSFETEGLSTSQRLNTSLDDLAQRTVQLDEALKAGSSTTDAMIARSEALLIALDSSVRELDEGHPAALNRLDERIEQSRLVLNAIGPEIEQLEAVSAAILGRAKDTEELLNGQGRKLASWLESGEQALVNSQEQVAALQSAIHTADSDAKRLADSSGPQLIATLLRVKEMAEQAGDRARQALSRAIADATDELGDTSEKLLSERLEGTFQARIEEVGGIADRAVKAAHAASDRLMRQLLTIADTTASIEQRISEAEEAAEKRDQDNFSHRSTILIESLNSIAIDVAKLFSEEVSDSSWSTYLKGDRGVFTRRAVRLLDASEARNIGDLYDANDDFREGVNRYIHDFEAMLRNVLAMRDGSSLGVTLLSSDIGKLYVALAQAIDRLR